MRQLWSLLLLIDLALLGLAADGFAQGNDLSAPTGGRSTLMGNTGVALARDGSAPFYNPATIVRIRDHEIAFSVNFYSLGLAHFDEWHRPGDVDATLFGERSPNGTSLTETSFRTPSSTLCLFFTLEDFTSLTLGEDAPPSEGPPTGKKLAVCFANLESEDVDEQAIHFRGMTSAGITTQVQSMQRRWNRTFVGPTYSISINNRFAIGGSLQFVYSYTSFGLVSNSLSALVDGGALGSAYGTGGSGRSFELAGVLGATYRIGRVTLGASLRGPSLHLFGSYDGTWNRSSGSADAATAIVTEATGSMRSAPPTRLALGVGYVGSSLTLELNAALSVPLQHILAADLDVTTTTFSAGSLTEAQSHAEYPVDSHPTLNPSAGLEYFFTPRLSILSGLSANFTALPALEPVDSVGNLVQARSSHVTASVGVGSYWGAGQLLFGLQFDYGWGQTLAVNPYVLPSELSAVSAQSYRLLFVLAGSIGLRTIAHTINTIANPDQQLDDEPKRDAEREPPDAKPPEARPQ